MIFLKKYFFSTQPSPSNHPKALLKEIKIEIKKNQGLISGLYKSTFKGKGLEFSSLRSYVRGDDIRAIDWNSFAKTGSMFVREYIEERDTTIILAIDSSQSQRFGHLNKSKYELISHVASLISHAALQNRDKLGLIHYSDQIESYDKPITGVSHNFKIISKIVNAKNSDKIAEVSVLVKFILNFQKKRAVILIFSDFLAQTNLKLLKQLSKFHRVIAIQFLDSYELKMPPIGLFRVKDLESGQTSFIDASDRAFLEAFNSQAEANQKKIKKDLLKAGVELLSLNTAENYIAKLVRFLAHQGKKR